MKRILAEGSRSMVNTSYRAQRQLSENRGKKNGMMEPGFNNNNNNNIALQDTMSHADIKRFLYLFFHTKS